MILQLLITIQLTLVKSLLSLLPSLPSLPESFNTSLNSFFNLIFSSLDLLNVFIKIDTLKFIAGVAIVALIFEKVYLFAMFILRKIPFLGIQ